MKSDARGRRRKKCCQGAKPGRKVMPGREEEVLVPNRELERGRERVSEARTRSSFQTDLQSESLT